MLLILVVLAVVLLNVAATVKVLWENRGDKFVIGSYVDDPSPRRWGQIGLVWLLPLLGSFIIFELYGPRRYPPSTDDLPEPHPYVMQGGQYH